MDTFSLLGVDKRLPLSLLINVTTLVTQSCAELTFPELAYNLTPAQQSLQPAGSPYADLSQQHFPQPAHIGQHQYAERPQPATEYPDANSGTLPDPHGRQQLAQSGMDAQLIMFD